ncbi:FecR family protein [Maribellus maritimus]|uniref:FecR family protein n=1 Tax=Maribellus maritimus TaxID=2870838 RepID=UPI001EEC9D3A|nr:FecR domain-containing protein [Maribellus maritimus]MCG6190523.1 DUF4974 domain-containing protein [Maribellus maritimus]
MKDSKKDKKKEETLLNKYLAGTASDDELRQLKVLTESSEPLKKDFDNSEKLLRQIADLEMMKLVNTHSAFAKVKDRLKRAQQKKGWFYYWQKTATILLLPLLLLSVLQFFVKSPQQLFKTSAQLVYNDIETPSGLRSVFELPDGTKVWLNGNTKIRYPLAFGGNERKITLEGEAYFKVAHDKRKPFIVDLGELHVQAVGTEFNCLAYKNDNLIETTLTEGSVKISRIQDGFPQGKYMLKPGETLKYEISSNRFVLKDDDIDKHVSWRSGKFVFRNDPLEDVCQKLGRWFNADIKIEDEELKDFSITGTFGDQGLNEILELITITSPINYNMEKREINENNEYETLNVSIQSKRK